MGLTPEEVEEQDQLNLRNEQRVFARKLYKAIPKVVGVKEISAIDLAILMYLEFGNSTLPTLVRDLGLNQADASVRVQGLVNAGRVARKNKLPPGGGTAGRHPRLLEITPKGLRLLRTAIRYRKDTRG